MRILAVTNIYPTPQVPDSGVFIEQQIKGLRQISLEVDVLFVERLQKGMGAYLNLGRQIRARVEHFQPDVVHILYGGVMGDQVTRAVNDRPTVVTFQGSDLLGEQSSGSVRRFIAGYGVWASWRAARRANGVVVVAQVLQDALPEDVDRSKVRIIPGGIDLERFKPLNQPTCRDRLGWRVDCFHILFPSHAGNSVKRYNLARAAVGALDRLGIHAEMHELQGMPNDQVPVWLNAGDVILLTSLHEGSPTIIKEALSCNLPVVSVDVGDVRERIQGIEGCYLALADPNDLAAKLYLVHSGSRRVSGWVKMQEFSLQSIALRLK